MLLSCFLSSCNDDDDTAYYFVGDSLIARWDIQASFPAHVVHNYGKSGSGIIYLESMSHRFNKKVLFVLSGTNDLGQIRLNMDEYVERYISAVENLGADTCYIISLLPRSFDVDSSVTIAEYNAVINTFNATLSEKLRGRNDIRFINVHDDLVGDDNGINRNMSYDGLHLNNYGYEVLSSRLCEYIK
jgi:lysophospholipase L1-like esterase